MTNFLNWLMENYVTIIVWVVAIGAVVTYIIKFTQLTPSGQRERVRLALLGLVTEAEKALGTKTGKIKRSLVYSAVVSKFPIVSVILPQSTFDSMLDDALTEFKTLLESNDTLYKYVYGTNRDGTQLTAEEIAAVYKQMGGNATMDTFIQMLKDATKEV